jgi:probable F420-dependent oxidoreductase
VNAADSAVVGYWIDRPPEEALQIADAIDAAGYPEIWIGEMATFDAFALATAVGLRTQLAVTIGPLAVHVRTPAGIALGACSVATLTGRTVRVAVGTSSPAVVAWHGRHRDDPAGTLALAAAEVGQLLRGDRGTTGFRLRLSPSETSITVAAFGLRGVDVAARLADRLVLNMVTVEVAAQLRRRLAASAERAEREVPRLAVWLPAAIDPEDATFAQLARGFAQYLQAPGYGEIFIQAGFAELVSMARTGASMRELVVAVPEDLAVAVGLVGSVDDVRKRIAAYRAAGVDEICIVPTTAGDPAGVRTLNALAPAPSSGASVRDES